MNVPKIKVAPEGPEFSRIVQGFWRLNDWQLSAKELDKMIDYCLDIGISTFDNADIYGLYTCEGLFGEYLNRYPQRRKQMELVTKCDIKLPADRWADFKEKTYETGKRHIFLSVEHSLSEMKTDYLDLLLIHRPDPLMDADEVAEAFHLLKKEGKVKYFGVSNFSTTQFDLLESRLDFPLVTNQLEFSPLFLNPLEDGTFDQCQQYRIAPMAWSPFAGGHLFNGDDEKSARVRKVLQDIGDELGGRSIDQVAMAWIFFHPAGILPIIGSGKIERIGSALKGLEIQLDREQWFRVWKASMGEDLP